MCCLRRRNDEGAAMRFRDRVAVVTGGAQGIGEGCVRVFAREGGHAAILDRNGDAGRRLAEELNRERAGAALAIVCDCTEFDGLRAALDASAAHFGRIDCLVNNVGWHPPATSLADTTLEEMERLMRLNFMTTFVASQAALPHLRRTRGTIVNIASMVALVGQDQAAAYCATKAAQLGFTRGLAVELGVEGIRVNAICPGNIETPLMHAWAQTLPDPQSGLARMASLQLHGKLGTIEEIGRIALFLATEDSSFLTGIAIEAHMGACLDY